MGSSVDSSGKRVFDDVYSFPADTQSLADDVHSFANVRVGSAAARESFPIAHRRDGMLWSETGSGSIYRADSALGWVLVAEKELRPGSVTGATVDVFGGVVPKSGVSTVRVDGIFSPRFRIYRVQFWLSMSSASAGLGFNLLSNGSPHVAAKYVANRMVVSGNSVTASSFVDQSAWSGTGVIGSNISGEWVIRNPASPGLKTFSADASAAPGGSSFSQERGWLGGAESSVFEGFQFNASTGTFLGGFVKVLPQG